MAICKAYKDYPKLRSLINDYQIEFDNKKWSIGNVDEQVQFFKDSPFFNYVPEKITKLKDVYSVWVKFILKRYFVSIKLFLENNSVFD